VLRPPKAPQRFIYLKQGPADDAFGRFADIRLRSRPGDKCATRSFLTYKDSKGRHRRRGCGGSPIIEYCRRYLRLGPRPVRIHGPPRKKRFSRQPWKRQVLPCPPQIPVRDPYPRRLRTRGRP